MALPEMWMCGFDFEILAYMRGDVIVEGDLERVLMACMEYLASNERKSL